MSQQVTQIALDDRMVTSYIAAQRDVSGFFQRAGFSPGDEPDAKMLAQLDALARKHGFAGFAQFDDVATNVSLVMGGLDPQTGEFSEPTAGLRHEIAEVTADRSIPAAEKKQLLDEMREALATMPRTLDFPGNVDVVMRRAAEIEEAMQ